jgi:hypothetical protein
MGVYSASWRTKLRRNAGRAVYTRGKGNDCGRRRAPRSAAGASTAKPGLLEREIGRPIVAAKRRIGDFLLTHATRRTCYPCS